MGRPPTRSPSTTRIVAERSALRFDYGKFDYVLHDGEAVLLDINATPSFGAVYPAALRERLARELAPGIEALLPASR